MGSFAFASVEFYIEYELINKEARNLFIIYISDFTSILLFNIDNYNKITNKKTKINIKFITKIRLIFDLIIIILILITLVLLKFLLYY